MPFDGDQRIETTPLLNMDDNSSYALELILHAWKEGEEQGVPREHMAYAAIFTAMSSLVSHLGEDAAAHLARGLERRVQVGEFSQNGTRQ